MKKEKETLDQQLRSMGINPPQGPSYIPTPAEMRPGPSLSFIGQDKDNMLSVRDRSLTTESYGGDLSEGMFVSTKDGPKTKPNIRIRSSSESEVPENKANSQQSTRVSFVECFYYASGSSAILSRKRLLLFIVVATTTIRKCIIVCLTM